MLCGTLFLLINSLNFRICLFFVNSKDFLYEYSSIFSTIWNSSGVIDSNGSYQLLKKDPITKIKTKTLKQLKLLRDNEFSDNKLFYYPSYQQSSLKY